LLVLQSLCHHASFGSILLIFLLHKRSASLWRCDEVITFFQTGVPKKERPNAGKKFIHINFLFIFCYKSSDHKFECKSRSNGLSSEALSYPWWALVFRAIISWSKDSPHLFTKTELCERHEKFRKKVYVDRSPVCR